MPDAVHYRAIMAQHDIPAGIDHDRSEETFEVGVTRCDDRGVTWQLRVCGVEHGKGVASSAADALVQAAFVLRDEAEKARKP